MERDPGLPEHLFPGVGRNDSIVTLVVGARRFISGWNSWRVIAIGLMHVGVGEGPEIVRMFGRGMYLKGWKMTLKWHCTAARQRSFSELEALFIANCRRSVYEPEHSWVVDSRLVLTGANSSGICRFRFARPGRIHVA